MIEIYQQTQKAYDQIVLEYERRNSEMYPNLMKLAQALAGYAGRCGHLLDAGCGTGRDMAFFETQGVNVTGMDLSAGMLAFARQRVNGALCQANLCNIPFASAYFDGAWCCASLLHLPKQDAPQALSELRRVLKPGGMLVLEIQAGSGEVWEESYVPGVVRFYARYQAEEMSQVLAGAGYALQQVNANRDNDRDWLSFVARKMST